MKAKLFASLVFSSLLGSLCAEVRVEQDILGKSLGGWDKKGGGAAEYSLSGTTYRTYKPEITPTPDGGIFISIRIDHVRGWLSSNDHAVLEITVDEKGKVSSAKSSIAIQGRSVTSDLIRGSAAAGKATVGVDRAVQIGTDLLADISAKMLREKIVEAGRVSFPSALRHNYNLLYQALRTEIQPKAIIVNPLDIPIPKKEEELKKAPEDKLEISTFGEGGGEVKVGE
ncbi:MAG: hypothetical protein ACSHX7_09290 [Luteolibacter sp.]